VSSASRSSRHLEAHLPKRRHGRAGGCRTSVGLGLALQLCVASLAACGDSQDGWFAASEITRSGFARDGAEVRNMAGRTIQVWGFVDHANLFGDVAAREILAEWWSGESRDAATWSFNLMAYKGDGAGQSFTVHVHSDDERGELLRRIVADARAGRATTAHVSGRLRVFEAPSNLVTRTGLYLEAPGSRSILLNSAAAD
jgi:hypothetical protein